MKFSHSVRALITLKSLIKKLIDNLGVKTAKLKFVSNSTIYKENNGAIVLATSPSVTPTLRHIAVKYHWFRQHVGKEVVIWKTDSKNQMADILTKGLQGKIFVSIRKFICDL